MDEKSTDIGKIKDENNKGKKTRKVKRKKCAATLSDLYPSTCLTWEACPSTCLTWEALSGV